MKKILFAVMAMVAIGLTSCGNKTQQGEAADNTEMAIDIDEVAKASIAALSEQLEAGDAGKLQQALEAVKTKIAELVKANPELAKEYVVKVQNFLKENAEKIKSVVGDNAAVNAAVSALTEVEPDNVVSNLMQTVGDAAKQQAEEVKDAAVNAAKQQVEEAKDAAKQKAEEAKEAAKQKASEAIDDAAAKAKSKLGL